MGINKTVVTTYTCDLCHSECNESDSKIYIQVNGGDGRDVGPAYIEGALSFTQPYGVSGGILCRSCKKKFLEEYLKTI